MGTPIIPAHNHSPFMTKAPSGQLQLRGARGRTDLLPRGGGGGPAGRVEQHGRNEGEMVRRRRPPRTRHSLERADAGLQALEGRQAEPSVLAPARGHDRGDDVACAPPRLHGPRAAFAERADGLAQVLLPVPDPARHLRQHRLKEGRHVGGEGVAGALGEVGDGQRALPLAPPLLAREPVDAHRDEVGHVQAHGVGLAAAVLVPDVRPERGHVLLRIEAEDERLREHPCHVPGEGIGGPAAQLPQDQPRQLPGGGVAGLLHESQSVDHERLHPLGLGVLCYGRQGGDEGLSYGGGLLTPERGHHALDEDASQGPHVRTQAHCHLVDEARGAHAGVEADTPPHECLQLGQQVLERVRVHMLHHHVESIRHGRGLGGGHADALELLLADAGVRGVLLDVVEPLVLQLREALEHAGDQGAQLRAELLRARVLDDLHEGLHGQSAHLGAGAGDALGGEQQRQHGGHAGLRVRRLGQRDVAEAHGEAVQGPGEPPRRGAHGFLDVVEGAQSHGPHLLEILAHLLPAAALQQVGHGGARALAAPPHPPTHLLDHLLHDGGVVLVHCLAGVVHQRQPDAVHGLGDAGVGVVLHPVELGHEGLDVRPELLPRLPGDGGEPEGGPAAAVERALVVGELHEAVDEVGLAHVGGDGAELFVGAHPAAPGHLPHGAFLEDARVGGDLDGPLLLRVPAERPHELPHELLLGALVAQVVHDRHAAGGHLLGELVGVPEKVGERLLDIHQQGHQPRVPPCVADEGEQPHRGRAALLRPRAEEQLVKERRKHLGPRRPRVPRVVLSRHGRRRLRLRHVDVPALGARAGEEASALGEGRES
mmetsp:Transcript_6483/g.22314  ORF Transcript_6483/g.22314 Transcript_6483/m.22314 type:complete len:824 (+) Transcript_6483:306-2777(+)